MTNLDAIFGTHTVTVYESVIGKIEIRSDVNGIGEFDIYTSVWVVYPDGMGEECVCLQEALEKLELNYEKKDT